MATRCARTDHEQQPRGARPAHGRRPTDKRPATRERRRRTDAAGRGTPDPQAPDASAVPGGRFTDDEARPIFREAAEDADAATVRTPAEPGAAPGAGAAGTSAEASGDQTAEGPARSGKLSFTPRARPTEDDATALLPRTTGRTQSRALSTPRPTATSTTWTTRRAGSAGADAWPC